MTDKLKDEAFSFDDVLLIPAKSEVLPTDVDVATVFSRRIRLNIPLVSSAMDMVTEGRLAIGMAREGGIGVIHKNMSIDEQALEVDRVKRSESGMIVEPVTLAPHQPVREALELMRRYHISGLPITQDGKLVGILTNRDLRFETDLDKPASEAMTSAGLVTTHEGTDLEEAKQILHKHRIEKLPVVDDAMNLLGLITIKDIEKVAQFPHACKDELGRLRVAAAVGVGSDGFDRATALVARGVDAVVVDSAHGHSRRVLETVERLKAEFGELVDVIGGNVGTASGCEDMIAAGADAVKVGMGPGSICTTRVVAGVGVPQVTAISECARVAAEKNIPLIADGGIRYSGDITKAIAAGADSVMVGALFAGTEESPGETVLYRGRTYKEYRGMGSLAVMGPRSSTRARYAQEELEADKLVPEGLEGRVPYKGLLSGVVYQLVGGLRAGMGYCGVADIHELKTKTKFYRITAAGLRESHPHDITITEEAPNYQIPE